MMRASKDASRKREYTHTKKIGRRYDAVGDRIFDLAFALLDTTMTVGEYCTQGHRMGRGIARMHVSTTKRKKEDAKHG